MSALRQNMFVIKIFNIIHAFARIVCALRAGMREKRLSVPCAGNALSAPSALQLFASLHVLVGARQRICAFYHNPLCTR